MNGMRNGFCFGCVIVFLFVGLFTSMSGDKPDVPLVKVGHVGHDHHLALFVAVDNSEQFGKATGITLRSVEDRRLYELFDGDRKVADIQIVKVGGGSKMPTALAQNVIEVGFGGVAAVLAAVDKGAPIKLIAPLHQKGDMFVLKPDFPASTWKEFVEYVGKTEKPVRIGYKNPVAVAKLVFEEALQHEGLTFTGNPANMDADVLMVNVKGGGKLNSSLAGGLVEGYVGNNPFPATGFEQGMLKIVCDLEELPPGTFRNHPCCCIAANEAVLKENKDVVADLLVMFMQATELINSDPDSAIDSACRWIGTTEKVERASIPTSGYTMTPSAEWHESMKTWFRAMKGLGVFQGKLENMDETELENKVFDFSELNNARKRLDLSKDKQ